MMPLCEILGISVNELLSGQRLSESEYKEKAEANMAQLAGQRPDYRRIYTLTGLGFFVPAVIQIVIALILLRHNKSPVTVQVLFTVGGSMLFIALVQFVLAYFLGKQNHSSKEK